MIGGVHNRSADYLSVGAESIQCGLAVHLFRESLDAGPVVISATSDYVTSNTCICALYAVSAVSFRMGGPQPKLGDRIIPKFHRSEQKTVHIHQSGAE